MDKIIGFIGYGNMGSAMGDSIIRKKLVSTDQIIVSKKRLTEKMIGYNKHNLRIVTDNKEVARVSDILILAIKPYMFGEVLEEIKDHIKRDAIVISVAAGISLSYLKSNLNPNLKIIRAMPNTPALVGEGMTTFCLDCELSDEEFSDLNLIFDSFGKSQLIDESLMDGATALAGASPAFVYMMIEALADGGVREGIPRNIAYKMAAQAVLGAAKMVLETGIHPGELKDKVCSPKGVTIEGVASLEETGFRASILNAVKHAAEKSKMMGN